MKYVGTYSDPKDIVTKEKLEVVASRVSTNEDNIAMAESDIDGLQTTVGTLQTNVNNVQTALTSKQDTVVGGASTITEDNLTASRALISNSSGKVAVSDVTSTELGYLDGVTSNVQKQLNGIKSSVTNMESDLIAVRDKYYYTSGTLADGNINVANPSSLINTLEFVKEGIVSSIQYSLESMPYLVCQSGSSNIKVVLRLSDIENIESNPLYIFTAYYFDVQYYHGTVRVDENGIAQFSERKAVVSSINGKTGEVTVPVLPTVTTADNGKFLRVVAGEWAVASVPDANGVSF